MSENDSLGRLAFFEEEPEGEWSKLWSDEYIAEVKEGRWKALSLEQRARYQRIGEALDAHGYARCVAESASSNSFAVTNDVELARLLPGLLDLARARIKALTTPGPPPLNLASESIKLARAVELLLGERERLIEKRAELASKTEPEKACGEAASK